MAGDKGQELRRPVSRRTLIKATAGGAIGAMVRYPPLRAQESTPSPEPPSTPEVERLKQEIQQNLGIKLSVQPWFGYNWTEGALRDIGMILPRLPDNFYKPDTNGRILNIELTGNRSHCCGYTPTERVLGYPASAFGSIAVAQVLGHEGTHMVTMVPVFAPDGTSYTFENPTAAKVEKILGGAFDEFRDIITPTLEGKREEHKADIWKSAFLENFNYGLGNIEEFQAVLGEKYVSGKQRFFEMYGLLLDPPVVGSLYAYIRDDVFSGREYEIPIYEMQ